MVQGGQPLSRDDDAVPLMEMPYRMKIFALASFAGICLFAAGEDLPSVRPLAGADFEAGIALARIGTGEIFDFDAPAGAGVCRDWEDFGAAEDWFRADGLTVFSYGTVRPSMTNLTTFVSPFEARIGIVPVANYGRLSALNRPSRFWRSTDADGSVVMTWQNVLLDRDTEKPVSFQAVFALNGDIMFRYDLSRLRDDVVGDVVVGVQYDGKGRVFHGLNREVTSLTWKHLDPVLKSDPDPDRDGISASDEVLVYGTDPCSADTDGDGLSDYDEIFVRVTDPRDRYSVDGTVYDGFAVKCDGLDPLSVPDGSDRTVLENVLYSGSATGKAASPRGSGSHAILGIEVEGDSGRGELLVGDRMIPLVPHMPRLLVDVPRCLKVSVTLRAESGLAVVLNSDEFCIGELPSVDKPEGWICFPNTRATAPCIHFLESDGNELELSLDPKVDFGDFECNWSGGDELGIRNTPDLIAYIKPNFPRQRTSPIAYTVSHPKYLFGAKEFSQDVQYCPSMEFDCKEDDEHASGDEIDVGSDPSQELLPVSDYSVNGDEYDGAVKLDDYNDILKLHRPENDYCCEIYLEMPVGDYRCCPCESHHNGYVALSSKGSRVSVFYKDSDIPFRITTSNCTIGVRGVAPSSAIGDAVVSLCKTGVVYETHNYTVFGVSICGAGYNLKAVNDAGRGFGLPVVIQTNLDYAARLTLYTDVCLSEGSVHLGVNDLAGDARFQFWIKTDSETNLKLFDTEDTQRIDLSIDDWRRITSYATSNRGTELYVVALGSGSAELDFGYAAELDGFALKDSAKQRLTAIPPPLLPDYNRDGRIDDKDVAFSLEHRFYFWTNRDIWQGDDAFSRTFIEKLFNLTNEVNGTDRRINGRNDLVNQLPLAVYIKELVGVWGADKIDVRLRSLSGDSILHCYSRAKWDDVRASVLEDIDVVQEIASQKDAVGGKLMDAELSVFRVDGRETAITGIVDSSIDGAGMMYVEAHDACENPIEIDILLNGSEVVRFSPALTFSDVDSMYRWYNIRGVADGTSIVLASPSDPVGWPDVDRDDSNLYFIHGYNMSETEAREWGRAFFKRMWWSGLNSKFHVVTWYGNDSQFYLTTQGLVSPNYQINVEHAFASASNLTAIVRSGTGKNYIAAHSLGNMLVSSAIHDWGLPYEQYFMLNAAVPSEAYDVASITDESVYGLTPKSWRGVDNHYRASHWFELDGFSQDDARRSLTWKNRFAGMQNAVNYYSSEEEVLKCDPSGAEYDFLSRSWAWYNQERNKGNMPFGRSEGGWGFNQRYKTRKTVGDPKSGMSYIYENPTPKTISQITDDLRKYPVFLPFEDRTLLTEDRKESIAEPMKAQLLADAIPAESFPAGFAPVPEWDANDPVSVNIDMAKECKTLRALTTSTCGSDWGHSYFLQVPYAVVYKLFDNMSSKIGGNER